MTKPCRFVLVAAVACGGSSPPPTAAPSNTAPPAQPPPATTDGYSDDQVVALGQFRDEACKCTTPECARAVDERMSKYASDIAGKPAAQKLSGSIQKIAVELSNCMAKAIGSNFP